VKKNGLNKDQATIQTLRSSKLRSCLKHTL